MTKLNDVKITRYVHDDEWYIDVVEDANTSGLPTYEAWLQHRDYSTSQLMFGLVMPRNKFMQILKAHVEDPELMGSEIDAYWLAIRAIETEVERDLEGLIGAES